MPVLTNIRTVKAVEVTERLSAGKRIGPITVPIRLWRDEYCLFEQACEWIQIPDGHPVKSLHPTNSGVLYITTARLVFKGERRSRTAKADDLEGAADHGNGVEVRRTDGKTDFFKMRRHEAALAALLIDALANASFVRADAVAFVLSDGRQDPDDRDDDIL